LLNTPLQMGRFFRFGGRRLDAGHVVAITEIDLAGSSRCLRPPFTNRTPLDFYDASRHHPDSNEDTTRCSSCQWFDLLRNQGLKLLGESSSFLIVVEVFPMKTLISFVALMFSVAAADDPAATRTWTDDTGKFTVEAELEELRDDQVVLKRADGTRITVPLERLSTTDRRYLASQAKVPTRLGREAIIQAMALPTNYAFDQTPLSQALQELASQHSVPVYLDVAALRGSAVTANTPITASGSNERLDKALANVLADSKLVWTISDDVLFVTTEPSESSMLETRVYAVLQPVRNVGPLIDQLTRTVAPESWEQVGGPGSIEAWPGGALVVAHTLRRHLEIEQAFGKALRPIVAPAAKPRQVPAGGRSNPLAALQQPSGCDFHETRLDDAIESLAKQHRVAIRFDQESVSNEGISLDRPVTLSLPPVSLESTLNLLLRQLHLTWTVREDSLVIISIQDEENYLLPITYNIADLRMALGNDIDILRDVVSSCIDAGTWDLVGGPGSIELGQQAGALQIRQTFKNHRKIERLFDDLRRIRGR
jgi:hypothetical protein